jgi:hypothetical protein
MSGGWAAARAVLPHRAEVNAEWPQMGGWRFFSDDLQQEHAHGLFSESA